MTSTQVPPVDLAHGMPSRVVTIPAADAPEQEVQDVDA